APVKPLLLKRDKVPVASVATWNPKPDSPDKERPHLIFKECYLVKGQAALSITGTADIHQRNCAFGPHLSLFHFRGQDSGKETDLRLENISAFVVNGPAFRLDE